MANSGWTRRAELLIFLAVMAVCLGYAAYTESVWEDFYITYRCSKNLVLGHGLVYLPGERVHTFTSPLGTLVPALLFGITAQASDPVVIWLFRIVCAAFLGGTALVVLRIAAVLGWPRWVAMTALLLLFLDSKTVEFSIDGMETSMVVFFVALAAWIILRGGPRRMLALGLTWGAIMWTRPDGFVYVLAILVGALVFVAEDAAARRALAWDSVRAALVALCVYAPWLAWATSFYGTPIPHTVVAKGLDLQGGRAVARLWELNRDPLAWRSTFTTAVSPGYAEDGGWPEGMRLVFAGLGLAWAFCWVLPLRDRGLRCLSLAFFLGIGYLSMIHRYPWYLPAWTMLGFLVTAGALGLLASNASRPGLRPLAWGVAGGLVAFQVFVLGATAYQMRIRQVVDEDCTRVVVGRWLAEHARPGDRMMLECLGYIGYFSGLKAYDFPGLSSPEMVAARRRVGDDLPRLIEDLKPAWLVVRLRDRLWNTPQVRALPYRIEAVVDSSAQVERHEPFLGSRTVYYDAAFLIMHRLDGAGETAPSGKDTP